MGHVSRSGWQLAFAEQEKEPDEINTSLTAQRELAFGAHNQPQSADKLHDPRANKQRHASAVSLETAAATDGRGQRAADAIPKRTCLATYLSHQPQARRSKRREGRRAQQTGTVRAISLGRRLR